MSKKTIVAAIIPYAALGIAGVLAYRFIKNSTVGRTLEEAKNSATDSVNTVTSWAFKDNPLISVVKGVRDWSGFRVPWD